MDKNRRQSDRQTEMYDCITAPQIAGSNKIAKKIDSHELIYQAYNISIKSFFVRVFSQYNESCRTPIHLIKVSTELYFFRCKILNIKMLQNLM